MKNIFSILVLVTIFSTPAMANNHLSKLEMRPIKKALLILKDIKSAKYVSTEDGGALAITLSDEGSKKLAAYSAQHIKSELAIAVNGEITSIRKIQSPLNEGKILLTPYKKKEAKKIIEMIKTRS